ncbi:hypothetical protein F4054_08040 [Candidatus Poribacteria bacterium]|nr:hypothetical protein [Candidatus Poribacteria bacterium]MYG05251.1 hypothetical protein [Candidatus Poribacteria bacterium]MYK22196.1 hypothetical protein [Candidatus Poribacteria bacterium]
MRIHTYLMLHKNGRAKHNLLWSTALAFLLWAPQPLFADISTLERIVEAEYKVAYVGARLRTSSSSRGTRTFEEYVIHTSEDVSYRKIVSVVGERRSFNGQPNRDERPNDNRRRENNENRRDRRERNRDRNEWRQIRSLFSKKEIELIAQNYNLEASISAEKIINYETGILTITPKFAGRPTKRIFFARENGVILRVEDLDAEGVLREMFVYTRISFNPEVVKNKWKTIEKETKPVQRRSRSVTLAEAEKILKTQLIQPIYLPPGFHLQDIRSMKSRERDLIFFEYTDGLVNFTLFEEVDRPRRQSDREREGTQIEIDGTTVYQRKFGSTDAFRWSGGKIRFSLVGAVPTAEMQKVVASIIQKTNKK